MRRTAKSGEEGGGGVGGAIATDSGPGLCPLEVILVSGGLDGQCLEALEEKQVCGGGRLTVRRGV